jgi:hypothetical protein
MRRPQIIFQTQLPEFGGHLVNTTGMQGLAAKNSPTRKKHAFAKSMLLYAPMCVIGTRWIETANWLPQYSRLLEELNGC